MDSLLLKVRNFLKAGESFDLLKEDGTKTDNIANAETISFRESEQGVDGKNLLRKFSLEDPTGFEIDGKSVPLKVIIHCWLHKDSSAADYLADCQEKKTTNVSFLQRTDLINWLSGRSESPQYFKPESTAASQNLAPEEQHAVSDDQQSAKSVVNDESTANKTPSEINKRGGDDPLLSEALSHERPLLDHNSSLHGSRLVNLGYLIKDAELKLVQSLKASLRSKNSQNGSSHGRVSKAGAAVRTGPRKDPIILIPSAASSLFTMANIKQFLQDSQYINPRDLSASHSDLLTVEKRFDHLSRPVRFIIVNNTRMFTKPEYWDRVVAVFTMGHTWQFNNYQWNTPQELFQHCKGYYFHFTGDSVPQHVQQWNVQQVELDKSKRFKDVEVARFFWNSLEKELTARGFH